MQAAPRLEGSIPGTALHDICRGDAPQTSEVLGCAPTVQLATGWPDLRRMMLLKLVSILFPTTDRKHPVVEPALLLIGSYLHNCSISCARHAACGVPL